MSKQFDALVTLISKRLGISREECESACLAIAKEDPFNPVEEFLAATSWDGQDRISTLLNDIMGLSIQSEKETVKRWLHQTLALAFNDDSNETDHALYGAEGVLVLVGKQGCGKTLLLSKLAVDRELFCEGAEINLKNKALTRGMISHWITELCYLGDFGKAEEDFIKSCTDNYRGPYEKAEALRSRRTSFSASVCNNSEVPASSLLWTVNADNFNLAAIKALNEDWIKQLWKQVYEELYLPNPEGFYSSEGKADTTDTANTASNSR